MSVHRTIGPLVAFAKTKAQSNCAVLSDETADKRLYFGCIDTCSTLPLFHKSEIESF